MLTHKMNHHTCYGTSPNLPIEKGCLTFAEPIPFVALFIVNLLVLVVCMTELIWLMWLLLSSGLTINMKFQNLCLSVWNAVEV